jgi:hypothetical protein
MIYFLIIKVMIYSSPIPSRVGIHSRVCSRVAASAKISVLDPAFTQEKIIPKRY